MQLYFDSRPKIPKRFQWFSPCDWIFRSSESSSRLARIYEGLSRRLADFLSECNNSVYSQTCKTWQRKTYENFIQNLSFMTTLKFFVSHAEILSVSVFREFFFHWMRAKKNEKYCTTLRDEEICHTKQAERENWAVLGFVVELRPKPLCLKWQGRVYTKDSKSCNVPIQIEDMRETTCQLVYHNLWLICQHLNETEVKVSDDDITGWFFYRFSSRNFHMWCDAVELIKDQWQPRERNQNEIR